MRSSARGVIQEWWNSKICESQRVYEILAGSTLQQVAGNANGEWGLLWNVVEVLSSWDPNGFSLRKLGSCKDGCWQLSVSELQLLMKRSWKFHINFVKATQCGSDAGTAGCLVTVLKQAAPLYWWVD